MGGDNCSPQGAVICMSSGWFVETKSVGYKLRLFAIERNTTDRFWPRAVLDPKQYCTTDQYKKRGQRRFA